MLKNLGKAIKGMTTPAEAKFNRAALAADDVEDSRRGRPAVSLQPVIEELGLTYADNEMAGSFVATLPKWPDYLFNGGRGALPGGRYGQIGHELLEADVTQSGLQMGGSTYSVSTTYRNPGFFGVHGTPPNEPFSGNNAWIPTTAVHVRAPETSRLPRLVIVEKSRIPSWGNPTLDSHGLPGYRIIENDPIGPDLIASVAAVCRPWLSVRSDPYLRLRVVQGMVNITVNGYRTDIADLRHLIDAGEGIADGLTAMMAPPLTVPFDAPGGAVGSLAPLRGVPIAWPQYAAMFAEAAKASGLHQEDALYLMSLLPSNPIPGLPWGVLFGTPAGCAKPCRIVWHNQGGRTESTVRGGLITPARAGARTPVGGIFHQPTAMYAEVVNGVAYCWNQQRGGEVDPRGLAHNGSNTLRELGLADI